MKRKPSVLVYALMGLLVLLNGCEKDDPKSSVVLTTTEVTEITETTLFTGGEITEDGGAAITARGVCWSKTQSPTVNDSKTTDGSGTGNFVSQVTGLEHNTTYYIRAYATNNAGTGYGNTVSFKTKEGVKDADGNVYKIVTIGTQTWMAENLKTTRYNDGSTIPLVTNREEWNALITPGYCWFDNDRTTYGNTYGALYNWYTVNSGKLCPTGWHMPTKEEWTTLVTYLGGEDNAGGRLKATGTPSLWQSPNTGANNQSGFTALPSGARYNSMSFIEIGKFTTFWASTEAVDNAKNAWGITLGYMDSKAQIYPYSEKVTGLPVRCIKD